MKKKEDFKKLVIELSKGEILTFYHNLPEIFGLDIDGALENWFIRTKDHSVKSLKSYVASKNTGYEILTEEEYNNLKD